MNIVINNIYRTNLSQPGGLVKVLEIHPSDYHPDGKACYIEHVEDHPYGYSKGTRGWYEDRDLVPVCQDCGEDLPEGETCKNCEMMQEGYNELCDSCGIRKWTKVSAWNNSCVCEYCYADEQNTRIQSLLAPDDHDWLESDYSDDYDGYEGD